MGTMHQDNASCTGCLWGAIIVGISAGLMCGLGVLVYRLLT